MSTTRLILAFLALLILESIVELDPAVKITVHVGIKVIANASNATTQLSKKQVSDIFLKKVSHWSNKSLIVPYDLKYDDPSRTLFSKVIHGRSPSFIKSYWQQKIFGGYELPPLEKDVPELLRAVGAESGAIGYVPADVELPGAVKEIVVGE
jgi:ABC-type phosphate transport system substrate-binding protein